MSTIGSTGGILGSAAGAPLSQTSSATNEGAQRDSAAVERRAEAENKSEQAGGIGQTEEDEQADERDADGRHLWESSTQNADPRDEQDAPASPRSSDASQTGNTLDLVG